MQRIQWAMDEQAQSLLLLTQSKGAMEAEKPDTDGELPGNVREGRYPACTRGFS